MKLAFKVDNNHEVFSNRYEIILRTKMPDGEYANRPIMFYTSLYAIILGIRLKVRPNDYVELEAQTFNEVETLAREMLNIK